MLIGDMSQLLPVIPLSRPVLFPGMIVRAHLSLETEVAAVDVHLETHKPLVVVPPLDPLRVNPGPADLHNVGCLAHVTRMVRLGDGSVRVLLEEKDVQTEYLQWFRKPSTGCLTGRIYSDGSGFHPPYGL